MAATIFTGGKAAGLQLTLCEMVAWVVHWWHGFRFGGMGSDLVVWVQI